jgi:UDP-N-acetylmuramyl pentapeptide phosphotransferase/UDP-N-acetylglucosamine-1-phosphate transferase
MTPNIMFFVLFFTLALLSYALVFVILKWLRRKQILDIPNQRSSHSAPTPRGGGLAIVILTLAAALIYSLLSGSWHESLVYIPAASVIAWLGWRDDVVNLSARLRIFVQSLVALLVIVFLGYFDSVTIPLLGELRLGLAGIPITLLWIVGLTNAYNFMDGIDGIDGGTALAAGLGWLLVTQSDFAFWVALALAASSLGFLGHNWSPARIFIGDVGSTFLGFSFALLPLFSASQGGSALLLGTLLLWAFIMDAGITFIRRGLKGERVFSAHRTHIYQRLVISGYSHAAISGLYTFLAFLGVGLALAWTHQLAFAPAAILIGLPLLWVALVVYTNRRSRAQKT